MAKPPDELQLPRARMPLAVSTALAALVEDIGDPVSEASATRGGLMPVGIGVPFAHPHPASAPIARDHKPQRIGLPLALVEAVRKTQIVTYVKGRDAVRDCPSLRAIRPFGRQPHRRYGDSPMTAEGAPPPSLGGWALGVKTQ